MELPLILGINMTHTMEMVVYALVGIGFGFFLERGGFGNSRVIAGVFYGRSMRVVQVIFTAIVTAMLGLYFLDALGIMPLGNIGILPTIFYPQLIGGLIFGVGFMIGGYCPGTSVVATVSGKVDAWFFVGGIFVGASIFTISYGGSLQKFHNSSKWGRVLLQDYFHVSSGIMVLLVTLMALGFFYAAKRIHQWTVNKYALGEDDL